jgi:hypothetical protein
MNRSGWKDAVRWARVGCSLMLIMVMMYAGRRWVRSNSMVEVKEWIGWHKHWAVETRLGTLQIIGVDDLPDGSHVSFFGTRPLQSWEKWDTTYQSGNLTSVQHTFAGCSWVNGMSTSFVATPYHALVLPMWSVEGMLGAVLAGLWMGPWWRYRRGAYRAQHNLCRVCGYDLRASPGRCPECGHQRADVVGGPVAEP